MLLLVDGDCGFCMRAGAWLREHTSGVSVVPLQSVDVTEYGLDAIEVTKRLHAVASDGVTVGAAAIAAALRRGSVWLRLAAVILDAPGVRQVAQLVYVLVARFRHRLPGGTSTCRLP